MTAEVHYGHVGTVPVHFDDLDAMGIVHNARYAVFLERALGMWWSAHGFTLVDGQPTNPDWFHAVAEYSISYRTPVRGTGEIGVHFWLDKMGESSAVYGMPKAAVELGAAAEVLPLDQIAPRLTKLLSPKATVP